jgi:TIR domain-containing protein
MVNHPENINVFILYAEEDLELKQELETHLSVLSQRGYIDVWHEGKIIYNKNTDAVISEYLSQSQIILLLISANFLAPDCYGKYEQDLKNAYERQKQGKAEIIPVILRPCIWQMDFLAGLNPLPAGGYPVRSRHWDTHDLAFQNITMGILNIVDDMKNSAASSKPPPLPFNKKTGKISDSGQDAVALSLINSLFQLMNICEPNIGAQRALPLIHKSLIAKGELELNFKKFKFWKAYEKMHLYKIPIEIKIKKNSGRKSIGILLDKESGTEWIYTLKKIEDLGGITGQVRIFFPDNGSEPKISSINL